MYKRGEPVVSASADRQLLVQILTDFGSTTQIYENVDIITVTGSASRFWELNSWDKTLIPKPFGKIQLVVSKPLKIVKKPKDSKEEVDILTTFINIHQDVADNITGKI